MTELPFSQACENNKKPILSILRSVFIQPGLILEIGTGTGQHAEYFMRHLPHLEWQPSDRPGAHDTARARFEMAALDRIRAPLPLDVCDTPWPIDRADGVFSANTAHIMSWPMVEAMFTGVGNILPAGGYFCLYGPFNENGASTSDSNARFDANLKAQDPAMGIRDREAVNALAEAHGLGSLAAHAMPANNQLLVWERLTA